VETFCIMTRSFAKTLYEFEILFAQSDRFLAHLEFPDGDWRILEQQADRELCQAIGYASI
jgi:hypothetical protein